MRLKTYLYLFLLVIVAGTSLAQVPNVGSPSIINFSRSDYQAGTQNWGIQQDERGIIYFANNKGLLEFDGSHWKLVPLPNATIVRSIGLGEQDRVYLGGQNEFGYLAVGKKGQQEYTSLRHLVPAEFDGFEDVWRIFIDEEVVYFCSEKAVFQLMDGELTVFKPLQSNFESFFQIEKRIILQDFNGDVFEIKDQILVPILSDLNLPRFRIVAVLPYAGDQYLVFTLMDGIFMMTKNEGIKPWNSPATKFLKEHQAYCAIKLDDGTYAVGTPHNGMLHFDNQGQEISHLNKIKGLQNNTVLSIMEDIQHNLWLGLDNGIDYAEINSPFSKIKTEEGIAGTGYASIVEKGKLYLGTNQGLFCADITSNKVEKGKQKFSRVKNGQGQVWSINRVKDRVIVGQHQGASYLEGDQLIPFSDIKGAWKFLALKSNPNYGIEGTYSGLYLYEIIDSDWKLIGKIKGFDESARILEEDEEGNIWVTHNYKGLYKVVLEKDLKSTKEVTLYAGGKGLPEELVINVTKVRNELLFATKQGIFQYDNALDSFNLHPDFLKIFGPDRNFHRVIEDEVGNVWFSVDNEFGVIEIEEQGVFNNFKVEYFNQIQDDLVDGFEHIFAADQQHIFIGTEKGFMRYRPLEEKNKGFEFKALVREVTSITAADSVIYWGNKTDEKFEFNYRMNDFRFVFSAPYYEKISYLNFRYKLEGFEEEWTEWSPKTEKEYTNLAAGNYQFHVQARNAYGQISEETNFSFKIFQPWYWSLVAKIIYLILGFLGLYSLLKYVAKREEKKTAAFKLEQTQKLELKEAEFKKEVEKSEGEIIKLRNEKLSTDISHKNSQLASATMHLVQKTEILNKIKNDLINIESEASGEVRKKVKQITRAIESDIQLDDSWAQFETYFDQVHENFFKRLREKYPKLTPKDQKLCAYLRMNLSTKEIAPLLNISVRGVEISRYRLRKKLTIESEVNLVAFIMEV